MKHQGKYMYGIIATNEAPNFGPIGIGGRKDEVVTIGTKGLAAVISDSSLDLGSISRENLQQHTRVIEKVFESFPILPMSFCTVAESTDEIISFLEGNEREIKRYLKDLEGKVEIGIKILWKDMKKIFQEIASENKSIRTLKTKGAKDRNSLIHAGELVETALDEKKAVEGEKYLRALNKGPVECKEGELKTEDMVANASFILKSDWVKEFDARVEKLGSEYDGRIEIKYIGPMPPFNFVDLHLHWNGGN